MPAVLKGFEKPRISIFRAAIILQTSNVLIKRNPRRVKACSTHSELFPKLLSVEFPNMNLRSCGQNFLLVKKVFFQKKYFLINNAFYFKERFLNIHPILYPDFQDYPKAMRYLHSSLFQPLW